MKIATWNVKRPYPRSRKNPKRIRLLLELNADIIVLTETHSAIDLGSRYSGHQTEPSYRKPRPGEAVAAVWINTDRYRIVSQIPTSDPTEAICLEIESEDKRYLVYGSILPYHGAKAKDGEAKVWDLHKKAIEWHKEDWKQLRKDFPDHVLITAGDYNQHRDGVGKYGTKEVRDLLTKALLESGLACVTEIDLVENGKLKRSNIDHICVPSEFKPKVTKVDAWEGTVERDELSDHSGVWIDIDFKDQ